MKAHRPRRLLLPVAKQWHRSRYKPRSYCGGRTRSPLLVATRRRSMKKRCEGQASTALDLALANRSFSKGIGARDDTFEQPMTTHFRNGGPGFARTSEPVAGVSPLHEAGFRDSGIRGTSLCTVPAAIGFTALATSTRALRSRRGCLTPKVRSLVSATGIIADIVGASMFRSMRTSRLATERTAICGR